MSLDGDHRFLGRFKKSAELLYTGRSRRAARFRYFLIAFDILTIAFFIVTFHTGETAGILVADLVIGTLILCDFLVRLWIAPSKRRMLLQIHSIADVVVILSLLLAPLVSENFAFLRILRSLRLLHSYRVLRDLRRQTSFFRRHEDVIVSVINLAVFLFVSSALVFVLQHPEHPQIKTFVDAPYFTVATLTTTGFGDIVLDGTFGRLLSVVIMVCGVALFFQLLPLTGHSR